MNVSLKRDRRSYDPRNPRKQLHMFDFHNYLLNYYGQFLCNNFTAQIFCYDLTEKFLVVRGELITRFSFSSYDKRLTLHRLLSLRDNAFD